MISVVIPTVGRSLLASTVNSIGNSAVDSGQTVEVVVADQSNTVSSQDFKVPPEIELQVVYSQSRGAAANRNHGAMHSSGQILAFVDDDCLVDRDWIACLDKVKGELQGRIVTGQVLSTGNPDRTPSTIDSPDERLFSQPVPGCYRLYSGNMAVIRSDYVQSGGFDESFDRTAEDLDFGYRWLRSGRMLWYYPNLIVQHQDWRSDVELRQVDAGYNFGQGQLYGRHALTSRHMAKGVATTGVGLVRRTLRGKGLSPTAKGVAVGAVRGVRRWRTNSDGWKWSQCDEGCLR